MGLGPVWSGDLGVGLGPESGVGFGSLLFCSSVESMTGEQQTDSGWHFHETMQSSVSVLWQVDLEVVG